MAHDTSLLRDLLVTTKDGDWGQETPQPGHIPYHVIRGGDFPEVRIGDVSNVPLRYLDATATEKRTLIEDDIIIETAGGNRDRPTGRTLLVTAKILNHFTLPVTCASFARFLRVDRAKVDPRYVFWYLQYLHDRGDMWQHQVQHTGVARFQYTRFAETVEIPLPTREDQVAIARILGTLDDKIELNRRMNYTLEAITRAIFQSWFVDFDPVVAKAEGRKPVGMSSETARLFPKEFEESPLGPIPKEWKALQLGDVLELKRGYDLPARDRRPGKVSIYSSSGPSAFHSVCMVKGPGVVTGRYGTIGEVFYAEEDFWPLNTTLYVRDFKGSPPRYIYYLLQNVNFQAYADKAAVPGINRNDVHREPVIHPPSEIRQRFEDVVSPFWQRHSAGCKEAKILTGLRDTLLPKLLSGELRVKEAEKMLQLA